MSANLAGLVNFILNEHIDIILLQEIRISSEQLLAKVGHLGFKAEVNINNGDPSKPGTAIVWKSCIPISDVSTLVPCRSQIAFLGHYILINIYAHSGSGKKYERGNLFARDIFQFLSLYPSSSLIMGGDYNSVLSAVDIEDGIGFSIKCCPQLQDLVQTRNLTDSFQHLHPSARQFTFFRSTAAPSRLDRFYLSSDLLAYVQSVKHLPSLSDHSGVLLSITMQGFQSSPKANLAKNNTYWKLNVAIL